MIKYFTPFFLLYSSLSFALILSDYYDPNKIIEGMASDQYTGNVWYFNGKEIFQLGSKGRVQFKTLLDDLKKNNNYLQVKRINSALSFSYPNLNGYFSGVPKEIAKEGEKEKKFLSLDEFVLIKTKKKLQKKKYYLSIRSERVKISEKTYYYLHQLVKTARRENKLIGVRLNTFISLIKERSDLDLRHSDNKRHWIHFVIWLTQNNAKIDPEIPYALEV